MMEIPEPRYTNAADGVSAAYQVFGRGRRDIVFLPGNATLLDVNWELPAVAEFLRSLAKLGRVIFTRMNWEIDVTHTLPAIHVPTLLLAKSDDVDFPLERMRWLSSQIAGSRVAVFPGDAHFFWVEVVDPMLEKIERFLGGFRELEAELERFLATVLFTDIVASTELAAQLGDRRWKELVGTHHARVRGQLARFRGQEIDTAGDGFFATFDGPARAIRCAESIVASVRDLGIEVRAGLHTGEVEQMGEKVGGIAANIGARVAARAGPSEIVVSQTVKDLVAGSGLVFEDAGERELKGVPDQWRLYRVVG